MTPDPGLSDVAAQSCYCVCHSDESSRPSCVHCRPTFTDEELAQIDFWASERKPPYVRTLIAALRACRRREIDAAKGYPDDLSTVPPNERAAILLANVRARGDQYGDVANSFGDLLRDALVLAAKELNSRDEANGAAVDVPPEVQATFDEFWRGIVMPDGRWDLGQVMRELHDYHDLLDEVPKVYMEVTGGMISKPNTLASEVLRVHDERCHAYCADDDGEPVDA